MHSKYVGFTNYIISPSPQIDSNNCDCTSQWWVPLSWATSMVNDAFNNKVKGKDGLIPKDHKDVVSVICKLRNDLYGLAEYQRKPLPAIYKQVHHSGFFSGFLICFFQAVWAAVWGWMVMGIVANQNTVHLKDVEINLVTAILLGFPVYGVTLQRCFA